MERDPFMTLFARFLDALYPGDCAYPLCGKEAVLTGDGVCASCSPLPLSEAPFPRPPYLDGLTAGLVYTGTVQDGVKRFKYNRQVWMAPFLSKYLQIPPNWRIDCAVPVPLHWLRQWQRSFNQSELLANELCKRQPFPVRTDILRRVRYTSSQARLSSEKRRSNLTDAFRASPGAAGLSVLLIDDVTTTHATLSECAKTLKCAGAARVYAACVCMAGHDAHICQDSLAELHVP